MNTSFHVVPGVQSLIKAFILLVAHAIDQTDASVCRLSLQLSLLPVVRYMPREARHDVPMAGATDLCGITLPLELATPGGDRFRV